MSASDELVFAAGLDQRLPVQLGYRCARDAVCDPSGWTVRSTPWRRTTLHQLADGRCLYRKLRRRRSGDAWIEWQRLTALAALDLSVSPAAFLARSGRTSVIATFAVPGRSLASLLAAGESSAVEPLVVEVVAPLVGRLHRAGWCYRDLYWTHLFVDQVGPTARVGWIDAERAFQPRWRRRRWWVKDLAGLLASWPGGWPPRTLALRFLRAYFGGELVSDWRLWARRICRKAQRIRAHRPRYG